MGHHPHDRGFTTWATAPRRGGRRAGGGRDRKLGPPIGLLTLLLACVPDPVPPAPGPDAACADEDGYELPAGSGPLFLTSNVNIARLAPDPGGQPSIDITGDGVPDGALNHWTELVEYLDPLLKRTVDEGRGMWVFELAGLCQPFHGADPATTLKLYRVEDCDLVYANTFCSGPGCGEVLARDSQHDNGQATNRADVIAVTDNWVESDARFRINPLEDLPIGMTIQTERTAFFLGEALAGIHSGLLCGHVPIRDLHQFKLSHPRDAELPCGDLPMCLARPRDLSLAEQVALQAGPDGLPLQPDVDVDGDGLERYTIDLFADPPTAHCQDGDGSPITEDDCLRADAMADAYSLCFAFEGVRARLHFGSCD